MCCKLQKSDRNEIKPWLRSWCRFRLTKGKSLSGCWIQLPTDSVYLDVSLMPVRQCRPACNFPLHDLQCANACVTRAWATCACTISYGKCFKFEICFINRSGVDLSVQICSKIVEVRLAITALNLPKLSVTLYQDMAANFYVYSVSFISFIKNLSCHNKIRIWHHVSNLLMVYICTLACTNCTCFEVM